MSFVESGSVTVGAVHVVWEQGPEARECVLQRLLAHMGLPAEEVTHRCTACGSTDHGPVFTRSGGVVLSLSRAGDLVVGAVAAASVAIAIGVDVEPTQDDARLDDLAPLFAPSPPPTLREWTEFEAVVKADGRGLRLPPSSITATATPGRVLPCSRLVTIAGRAAIEVAAVPGPAGYVTSVALDPTPESAR